MSTILRIVTLKTMSQKDRSMIRLNYFMDKFEVIRINLCTRDMNVCISTTQYELLRVGIL